MDRGVQRRILLIGAFLFGAFAIVAFVFRRLDVSQQTLSIVGGAFAYVFLMAVAIIVIGGYRRRARDAAAIAASFVERHPAVLSAVGRPMRVGRPEGQVPPGKAPAQANLDVLVTGPEGVAKVDLVMARLARRWEVLSATLLHDGERVPLRKGPLDTSSVEDP